MKQALKFNIFQSLDGMKVDEVQKDLTGNVILKGRVNLENTKDSMYSVIDSLQDINNQHYQKATKDIKTNDIKTKDIKTKDIKTKDIKTKDRLSASEKIFKDHFTCTKWQLSMIDATKIVLYKFIICHW